MFFDGAGLHAYFLEVAVPDDIFFYLNCNLILCPRQFIDTLNRVIENALLQINTGKGKKALENLEKAEKLSIKAKRPDYLCTTFMLRGRALLAEQRDEKPWRNSRG